MKRKRRNTEASRAIKRPKSDHGPAHRPSYPLLRKYYSDVVTLRQYIASRLAKKRRKALQRYGRDSTISADNAVIHLLDATLVGAHKHVDVDESSFVEEDITIYTQQLTSSNASISLTPGDFKQTEIVDFAIWMLFRRHPGSQRPKHLLCQNFQRYLNEYNINTDPEIVPGIPGVYSSGPNEHVQALRSRPWNALPTLLGRGAERILTDLLIECGIFMPVDGSSNFVQLSGMPMSELNVISSIDDSLARHQKIADPKEEKQPKLNGPARRGLSDIRFVRHRMFYARAASNAKGTVKFGLSQVHVLNRNRDYDSSRETIHVMKYIFPAQFGLHNVLTSDVDSRDTMEHFMDYTLREKEINRKDRLQDRRKRMTGSIEIPSTCLPRRVRGKAQELVHRLRKRHAHCSYSALLDHYCNRANRGDYSTNESIQQATSVAEVSVFCRAVISKVFPKDLWGSTGNARTLHQSIDCFIRLRRYESMSLHDVAQGMKLSDIAWLASPKTNSVNKLSNTDLVKRKELMAELLYYTFDSFLIPLLRSHFHVTESNTQRNQLFYFRHDVWRELSEPAFTSLKHSMLEEVQPAALKRMSVKRSLGISNVRLLPKEQGMRPIINLRRRVQKLQNGKLVLGKSINSLLTPVFSVLNYEKVMDPNLLGSALFSVDDMFPRLQRYRQSLADMGLQDKPLYFAKVDVQACFDTIPQKRLMQLVERIIRSEQYQIARYSRTKLTGGYNKETPGFGARPSWKFLTKATSGSGTFDFSKEIEIDTAEGRTRSVYINGIAQRRESRQALLALLEEHLESNLIKIGSRFYRQREGIPQGSIVSGLLCSYFYAELEREVLGFASHGNSVLMRLIDDFMVISTERTTAERFIRVMHDGVPQFGVKVKAEKSQANFEVEIGGKKIMCLAGSNHFPYCGNAINTKTLNLSKDQDRRQKTNSMTVEHSKLPGQSFYRKTLNAIKLQLHAMLLSTTYNSIETVLSNLYHSFHEVAQKSYYYIKSLASAKQPSGKLVSRTFDDCVKLACVLMRHRKRTSKDVMAYKCCVTNTQARWLACNAFGAVFGRRQTRFGALLDHLREQLVGLRVKGAEERRLLQNAVMKSGGMTAWRSSSSIR